MTPEFKAGDIVFAKENAMLKLIIRRYVDSIYYCQVYGQEDKKDKVYFERELMPQSDKQRTSDD